MRIADGYRKRHAEFRCKYDGGSQLPFDDQGHSMLGANNTQTWLMFCGLGILVWLFMRAKLKIRRGKRELSELVLPLKHNANAQIPATTFSGTQSVGAPKDVLQWQLDLHDLARDLKAELDCKMIAVRQLTESYDQAAGRLADLIETSRRLQTDSTAASPNSPAAQMTRLAAAGFNTQQIAEQFGVDPRFVATLTQSIS